MATATKKAATRRDPSLVPQDPDLETWKNVTPGIVAINRVGEYGRKIVELIHGERVFSITPQERRMNQGATALPELDVFTNGTLSAVSLIEGEPDTAMLRDNPNMIDDREILLLFRLDNDAFRDRIGLITNAAALGRLAECARDAHYQARVHQYELVKLRERALAGDVAEPPPDNERQPKAVTPR